jgi:uncharacterized protein with HEPN domain
MRTYSFRQMRNITARTYDPAKARQVHEVTSAFLTHARALLARLHARGGHA